MHIYKWLFSLILLFISLIYSTPSDTITYRQRRGDRVSSAYLDVHSGCQRVVSIGHSYIHNYQAYSINHIDTLQDDECLMLAFKNGTNEVHVKFISAWAEGSPNIFSLIENPDTIDLAIGAGDTLTPRNRNREEGDELFPSTVIVTDSVDTAEGGLNLDPAFFGGGTGVGNTSLAGAVPSEIEWIMAPGDFWYACVQNIAGSAKYASLCIFWYELRR
ncbi:hypothetical protein KAR91_48810 [Candidatus Pacearchaeota archaeon]|nr:hypothetical protein [Candidatus Pacearchaeota archaeon]